jgi:predicted DsbA family dithiol-disulfide isomerase
VEIVLEKVKNIPNTNVQQLSAWAKERRQDILQLATQIFNSLDESKKNVRNTLFSFWK